MKENMWFYQAKLIKNIWIIMLKSIEENIRDDI